MLYTSFQIQTSSGKMMHKGNFMHTQTLKNYREHWSYLFCIAEWKRKKTSRLKPNLIFLIMNIQQLTVNSLCQKNRIFPFVSGFRILCRDLIRVTGDF